VRLRRDPEDGEAVTERLRGIWPQAQPRPGENVEAWRRRDSGQPAKARQSPPPPPLDGRSVLGSFDPGRRRIRALAAVAAVVVLVAGYLAWRAQPRPEPVPAASSIPAPGGPPEPIGPASASATSIVVAVQGRVRHPGLVRLPAGARVQDAIEAAGGAVPGTDLSFVNLARRLVDGELLVIGVTPPPGVDLNGGAGTAATAGGRVNLNTATLAELDGLPGIGPSLAQHIIDYRTAHGGFHSVNELRQVEGIGDAKFAQLKDRVTV
jgi:competence protein ComEA